jgi:cation diffusion facilitator CzcD-associated flavoprotein CzcO
MTASHPEMPAHRPNHGDAHIAQYDVIIIGAGMTGLYQLYKVRELGLSVRCFEYGGGVGGTWYWNRYPGACFDSESETYAYDFSEELHQEWDWKHHFSLQPDTERYYNYVADKFDLRRDIQLNALVEAATWDEEARQWEIRLQSGQRARARFVMGAVGILASTASYVPAFPGIEDYQGEWHHPSHWPHEPVSFTGKRVGVVGTGSTGVQIIEQVAKDVGHLTVFQRTATWTGPLHNAPVSEETQREWKQSFTEIFDVCNNTPAGFKYVLDERKAMDVPKEERWAKYEYLWGRPGFEKWLGNFFDITIDKDANDDFCEFMAGKIQERVEDPVLAEKLTPKNVPFGARRIPMETDYYEVFNQRNVTLVDVKEAPIERITPTGIRTSDGQDHELDMIIFATGFDSFTGGFTRMDIRGEDGRSLKEKWDEYPGTCYGLMVAGFPNFFTVVPRAFCNFPRCSKVISNWVTRTIEHMEENKLGTIVPTQEAEDAWVEHQNSFSEGQLFASKDSWFNGGNIPGKKKAFLLYANTLPAYRSELAELADSGYPGFAFETKVEPPADAVLEPETRATAAAGVA